MSHKNKTPPRHHPLPLAFINLPKSTTRPSSKHSNTASTNYLKLYNFQDIKHIVSTTKGQKTNTPRFM